MKTIKVVLALVMLLGALTLPGVVAAALAPPTQEKPLNGATDQPTTVWVYWTISNPEESYGVQLATNAAFTAIIADKRGITNQTAWGFFNLTKGATYYWRVNMSKGGQTSPWSPIWSFTITTKSPPAAPTLVSPQNGAGPFPTSQGVTLAWNAAQGAESYDFMVAGEPSFGAPDIQWYGFVGTSIHVSLDEVYTSRVYWRVRGRNPGGLGPWSEVRMFTVDPFR